MLQITFRHMDASESLRELAQEKFDKLAHHFSAIPRCHVVVDTAPGHSRKGGTFTAHVELSLGREDRHIRAESEHELAASALREAFELVERQLTARDQLEREAAAREQRRTV